MSFYIFTVFIFLKGLCLFAALIIWCFFNYGNFYFPGLGFVFLFIKVILKLLLVFKTFAFIIFLLKKPISEMYDSQIYCTTQVTSICEMYWNASKYAVYLWDFFLHVQKWNVCLDLWTSVVICPYYCLHYALWQVLAYTVKKKN